MTVLSRRSFVARGLCGCALCFAGAPGLARVLPSSLQPQVTAGYEPSDKDERGLWHTCDRIEEQLAASNLLVADLALRSYLTGIVAHLLGDTAADLRIYLVRDPEFNASMFPNGMMLVHTGLLVRMRNEAQLAAVLGHEAGHYLRRHSLSSWRDQKNKSAVAAFIGVAGGAVGGGGIANLVNSALMLSMFSYSRELESEADAYGLKLLHDAHYPPKVAAQVWQQVIEERKASAAGRKKKYQDRSSSALSTHPPSAERMSDLNRSAVEYEKAASDASPYDDYKAQWLAAIGPMRAALLDEQIKLNDSGASLYLLNSLAQDGWDGLLRYYEGEAYRLRDEAGDGARAGEAYAAAVQFTDAPPEAHRAHGYAQMKAGNSEEGRRALTRYLELQPNAADAAMVNFSLTQ